MILLTRGSRFAAIVRTIAPLTIVAMVAGVLRRFPPAQYSFYPRCPIYEAFHLQCPGCGATRAIAALLQGRLSEAMHLNALVTLLLPVAAAFGVGWYWRFVRREDDRWPRIPGAPVYVVLGAAAIFTVLRNLPLQRFQ